MKTDVEEPRVFSAGYYTCPATNQRTKLETDVPRAWVHWPVTVQCSACHATHLLKYEDVFERTPAFGWE